jgi:GTP-binding protein SAR1
MASYFSWFWDFLEYLGLFKKKGKILFLGLDNAGKTTLLHMLKDNRLIASPPTFQPNMEEIMVGNMHLQAWDLGGHSQARRVWHDYIVDVDGIVFIVDAVDQERLHESKKELDALLNIDGLEKVPFLVLGNKIDDEKCLSEQSLRHVLGLNFTTGKENDRIEDNIRPIELFMCSVIKRYGYLEGFRWMGTHI